MGLCEMRLGAKLNGTGIGNEFIVGVIEGMKVGVTMGLSERRLGAKLDGTGVGNPLGLNERRLGAKVTGTGVGKTAYNERNNVIM